MAAFISNTKEYIGHLRKVEHDVVFKQADSFYDLQNLEKYSKIKFFEDERNFRESIPKISSFVPRKV